MESTKKSTQYGFIVVMGVSGSGKSTLGSALANALDFPYVDGDDLHPRSNIDKMSSGISLTDEDREPWLALIRQTAEERTIRKMVDVEGHDSRRKSKDSCVGVVITCSALKKHYRDILRGRIKPRSIAESESSVLPVLEQEQELPTYFVYISGSTDLLRKRMEVRPGHFMKASMLDGQLAALESPEGEDGVVVVSLEDGTEEQVKQAIEGLRKAGGVAIDVQL
ncbi:hypothetical protein AX15_005142 [Amanita polypyramis BW_CC]|nr:hypothetical protein AX15_005142 [Amanita polypyramis BW_CC]